MANVNIKKCDVCKREARDDTDVEAYKNDFDDVTIRLGNDYSISNYYSRDHECKKGYMLLCHECMAKLGITRKPKKEAIDSTPLPSEQLYGLICDIVNQAMDAR